MYTVGKGFIIVRDKEKAVLEKSQRRPKKPMEEFILKSTTTYTNVNVDVEGEDDHNFLHLELQGMVFGDKV
jgi:hypothetical protein